MGKKSNLENELMLAIELSLLNSTPGFEHSFIVGWLQSNYPKLAEALQSVNPNGQNVIKREEELSMKGD